LASLEVALSKARPSVLKRRKEETRRERQRLKAARRAERAVEQREQPDLKPGEDPDIAGIVPGPQPPREED
jgi:hypothetical protein